MNAEHLFAALPTKEIRGVLPDDITDVAVDSRAVHAGGVFVCIEGYTVDGHRFVQQAIQNGARVIVASKEVQVDEEKVAIVYVPNTSRALGLLASRYYDYPSKKMTMIGVTGTNGKTSVGGIIHAILLRLGEKAALTGTIGFNLNGVLYETENTTTDALTTQQMIAQAVAEDCSTMVMEVSSHGLVEGRLAGTEYDIAIFTNLSHDHLDFHGTLDNYGHAKSLLFAQLGQDLSANKAAIVNVDDAWGMKMAEATPYPLYTYAIDAPATFQGTEIQLRENGTTFTLVAPMGTYSVEMPLIGRFSVYNALAAIAALVAKGIAIVDILTALRDIPAVKGRMERVQTELPLSIYIDYAHSPDAIEKAISAVLPYKKPTNKLIFLIGTGGNRDRLKRPIMAEKASVADYVILTTDDPRDEAYESILTELEKGMLHKQYACIGDREQAVQHAIEVAEAGDIIILAGKGHEDFQIIGKMKYPHSDAIIALQSAERKFSQKKIDERP